MKKTLRTLAASVLVCAAAFFTFVACSEDEETTVPVTSVAITEGAQTLTVGGTLTLTATVKPDNASNKAVTWTSSHPAIAGVGKDNGVVTAGTAAGTTTITVTTVEGSKTNSVTVTVVAAPIDPVRVDGVAIDQDGPIELVKDSTLTLTATVAPTNASTPTVTWTSSSTVTATVDADGVVTAVAVGAATITVTTVDGSHTATVGVTVAAPALTATPDEGIDAVPNTGDSYDITVTSNVGWTVTSSENWLELSTGTGNAGNGTVTVTVQPNDTFDERSATVTFTYGAAQTETVNVTQEAAVPALLAPDDGANFILSKELDGNITFSWLADADVTYEVIVAKNVNLTEDVVYSQRDLTGTSHAVAEADIQALLESTSGLKRYYKNQLYWGVKTDDGEPVGEPRELTLSGQRIFVDVRGSESNTYEVAVIDNTYYKGIWMAEDLRTRKKADGTDVPAANIQEAPSTATFSYNASGHMNVAPPNNPRAGYYYVANYCELFNLSDCTTNPNPLAPAGWKVPEKTDWDGLFGALATLPKPSDDWVVVVNPDVYARWSTLTPGLEYGSWGLNLASAGYFNGDNDANFQQEYGYFWYMIDNRTDGAGVCYHNSGTSATGSVGWERAPVRLKYIGDE